MASLSDILLLKNLTGKVTHMPEFKTITPEELESKLQNGEKLHLIDVREDEEVAEGMIPGAVHIPMGQIPEAMDQLDEKKEYIIICRSGGRSGRVCQYLLGYGYNVTNMDGGMLEWKGTTESKN